EGGEARSYIVAVLHHEDGDQAVLRVDGHVGGVGAAVAEGVAAGGPAEAVAGLEVGRRLPPRHLLDRRFRDQALARVGAVIEHHPAEDADIGGRREQAAPRAGITLAIAKWIPERGDDRLLEAGLALARLVRLGQPLELRLARPERRVLHAKRAEQALV